jgi:hypothetical protein
MSGIAPGARPAAPNPDLRLTSAGVVDIEFYRQRAHAERRAYQRAVLKRARATVLRAITKLTSRSSIPVQTQEVR